MSLDEKKRFDFLERSLRRAGFDERTIGQCAAICREKGLDSSEQKEFLQEQRELLEERIASLQEILDRLDYFIDEPCLFGV